MKIKVKKIELGLINFFQSKAKKILLENFFSLTLLQVANYVFPLVTFPYLVRILEVEKYGLIAFANSFVGYFMIITDYGFNLSATREISINREYKQKLSGIFSSVMIIKFLLILVSLILMTVIVFTFNKFRQDWILYYLTFGMVLGHVMFPQWFFQGIEKMKFITLLNLLAKLIFTISIFIFVKKQSDYYRVPLLNSLGFMTVGVMSLCLVFYKFGIRFLVPTKKEIVKQLKDGWHIFISTVAISLYTTSRIFLVGVFSNNTITGYYAIAEKIMNIFQMFPLASFLQTIYPRFSNIFNESPKRAYKLMSKMQNICTFSYLILCILLFIIADKIVRLVSGEVYKEATIAFRILILAIFFINANAFRVQFFLVAGKDSVYLKIHIILGSLGTILLFLLTYFFSYIGTALSIVFIAFVVLIYSIRKINEMKEINLERRI